MHKASLLSNETDTSSYKIPWPDHKIVWNMVKILFNEFIQIENVYLFPEVTVGDVKWIFCYKEGIFMETDPFPAYLCRILNILL